MDLTSEQLKSKSPEELVKIVKQLQRKCRHQETEIQEIQESFKESSNILIERIKDIEMNNTSTPTVTTNEQNILSFNNDQNESIEYSNPFSKFGISDSDNDKNNMNKTSNSDQSTRPQTAVIFNDIIKNNKNKSSVEHHLQILNNIRNKSQDSNKSNSVDIFNDGLDKNDSSSESDSEDFNITEDDLRLEFAKSIDIKGEKSNHNLNFNNSNKDNLSELELGMNKGGSGIKSLKNLMQTNKTFCSQCNKQVGNDLKSLKEHMEICTKNFRYCKKCNGYQNIELKINHQDQQNDILNCIDFIKNDNKSELEKFLKHEIKINKLIEHNGRSLKLIHLCVIHNADQCLKLLMTYNASVSETDSASRNVIYYACEYNRHLLLEELLGDVSDDEIVGLANNGLNAVHICVKKGHVELFQVLTNRLSVTDLSIKTGMNEDLHVVARQSGSITMKDALVDLGIGKL